ncbi:MAG: hypothetical protein HC895_06680 [Leptolyngbyaceae cyanobacterium SM1_3_5]|nr:hypothetical protein [Leptolyngbyaceae cyanobacterium SM1_3_5]
MSGNSALWTLIALAALLLIVATPSSPSQSAKVPPSEIHRAFSVTNYPHSIRREFMPRAKRNQPEPEPAPDFPTDVNFDFTPPQSETQTQPQSNIRPFPSPPTVQRSERPDLPSIDGLAQVLEAPDLNFAMPDFVGSMPTDLYRPSTSSIPEIDDAEFQRESLCANNKLNAVKLENRSLELMEEKSKGAVIASRVTLNVAIAMVNFRKAQVNYLVGMEAADVAYEVGTAKNAETRTNGFKEVSILQEKGRSLDERFRGSQIKTNLEREKNANSQLDVDHQVRIRPVIQEKLDAEFELLKNSASEARQKLSYA